VTRKSLAGFQVGTSTKSSPDQISRLTTALDSRLGVSLVERDGGPGNAEL
jgi:hypothetical protein